MKNDLKLSLTQHLGELRRRLIFCLLFFLLAFGFSYYYSEAIYAFILKPLEQAYIGIGDLKNKKLIYTDLTEAFTTYLKLSVISSLFFSLPFILLQIYLFVAPGLYKKEKKIVLAIISFSPLLFFCGAAFVYYFIAPLAFRFFLGFERASNSGSFIAIELQAKIGEYLDLFSNLIFAFGLAFQLPIIMILLVRMGILSAEGLRKKRKYWIILIFIIAAIITPPDVISQIAMALPMCLFYELAIIICVKLEKKEND